MKVQRLAIAVAILVTLVILLMTDVLKSLPDSIYQEIGDKVGYEFLLKVTIFLLFALIISIFYYRSLINAIEHSKETPKSEKPESNSKKPKKQIADKLTEKQLIESYKDTFETLASDEKELLRKYIISDKSTLEFSLLDGTANTLCSRGILVMTTGVGIGLNYITSYSIQPWAFKYLKKNSHLLEKT